jgi:hypothetical protein
VPFFVQESWQLHYVILNASEESHLRQAEDDAKRETQRAGLDSRASGFTLRVQPIPL